ncbi:hemolysin [Vibrio splendidus]|uniref:L-ornithine N(alpha)-acyltransferase n=1 Tax=Vibrio splendidus TaxID=29497 RepID=A0AB35N3L2_VIBSP|nr:lysophospholipid acyltransferase family protein [Vibrio splendidus]MDP2503456.1 lysophospholipid acyltransferase family protein [Vibrio splendidus]PMG52240.1 hemolysin [Vibrio splendidus]PMM76140.1 hemolysin [Vibrio splendidus]
MIDSPFRLPRYTPFGLGESVVEWATGLSKLDKLYQDRPDELSSFEFMHHTLSALNIDYSVSAGATDDIPEQGPVVIVANHPLGAIEGVILADLVGSVRKDVKVLANELLKRLPELDDLFIGVDVFNSKESKRTNAKAIRDANRHLADGGLLIVFPAGEVSSYRKGAKTLTDIEWSKSVAKFVKRHQATTVPIFINGKNSELFYQAGRVHPLLRTALLGRELLNKQATTISISIGSSIPYSEIRSFEKEMDIVNYLRLNTYLMSQQDSPNTPIHAPSFDTQVIAPIPPEVLAIEVDSLPEEMKLLEQGDFEVYCTPSQSIPNLMREIGRVREESFREVGEGSGLACDLDEYDLYYHQLFVWNKTKAELVGAYRLGMVDKLIAEHELDKLYSRSLFNYNQEFIDTLDNSIELGRSVVSKPYQKSLNSLLLLWKGIAAFVYRHPQYTHLFGPVSISNDYSHNARLLIATTLSIHHYDEQKANLVSPSSPLNTNNNVFWQNHLLSSLASVPLLSKVLARMEQGKGLPVLLRQYLGMNGKLVCFNVDPSFNDALDGLIVVNLKKVPLKTLGKYMGRDLAQDYLEQHSRR